MYTTMYLQSGNIIFKGKTAKLRTYNILTFIPFFTSNGNHCLRSDKPSVHTGLGNIWYQLSATMHFIAQLYQSFYNWNKNYFIRTNPFHCMDCNVTLIFNSVCYYSNIYLSFTDRRVYKAGWVITPLALWNSFPTSQI